MGIKRKRRLPSIQAEVVIISYIEPASLIIFVEDAWIGASPYSIATNEDCSKGVVEVKCLYLCLGKTLKEAAKDSIFAWYYLEGLFSLNVIIATTFECSTILK